VFDGDCVLYRGSYSRALRQTTSWKSYDCIARAVVWLTYIYATVKSYLGSEPPLADRHVPESIETTTPRFMGVQKLRWT
jgi:hypothetical protein